VKTKEKPANGSLSIPGLINIDGISAICEPFLFSNSVVKFHFSLFGIDKELIYDDQEHAEIAFEIIKEVITPPAITKSPFERVSSLLEAIDD